MRSLVRALTSLTLSPRSTPRGDLVPDISNWEEIFIYIYMPRAKRFETKKDEK